MTSPDELLIPKSRLGLVSAHVLTAIAVTFVAFALRNLSRSVAVVPSLLWIFLVVLATFLNLRERGVGAFLRGALAAFLPDQVFAVRRASDDSKVVEHRVPARDIATVNWSKGQASDMAGRDANDWVVFLWYSHRDSEKEQWQKEHRHRRPDQSVLVIGPSGARSQTESLARRIIDVLEQSGISVIVEEPTS